MRGRAVVLALVFLLSTSSPVAFNTLDETTSSLSPSNPTGVDVRVVGASVEYTNSADEAKYKMFSSNHPILGFNRPAELFVIDAMVNITSTLTITVENIGTSPSGVIDVNVLLLHDEYIYFEFSNTTVQMASLSGSASNTVTVDVTPSYAGNHTLQIRATSSVSDDVPGNDVRNQPFTVGYDYFNCDSSSAWTFGNGWQISTDTSISQSRSCHAGNGQSSNYNNNALSALTTPVMDLSDAVLGASRTSGLSFFYTGSTAVNDKLTIYGKNGFGAWAEIGSITGTIDNVFTDGANWQTFSVNNKGHVSPLIPVADELFHSTSQFKFEFTSDASGTDIGFYIDDIVLVYDQKVRQNEYAVSAQGISTTGATPGEWGSVTLEIVNTGNISDSFIPTLEGLPASWNAYYSRPSGTSFDPLGGLIALPGSPAAFSIQIQPDENASIGFQQMSVNISSSQYPEVYTVLPIQFLVKADRIPVIVPPSVRPSCPPSYTCTFEVGLTNEGGATDVFDLSMDMSTIPNDWTVSLAWTQSSSVLIRPNETIQALFTMTVPADEAPDSVVEFDLTLQSQNDTSRVDVKPIAVSASMISIADVSLTSHEAGGKHYVEAGGQVVLKYTIWNNASRQDIFGMRVDVENAGAWNVQQPTRPDAVLNSGTSTTFEVVVDVPENAQANDRGPTITPVIESKRSLMEITGDDYDGLRVTTTHDVTVEADVTPTKLTPGVPNELMLKLINNGNGPTDVTVNVEDVPSTWTWWLTSEGVNITEPISLSVSYDLQHEKDISLWILLPMTEAAGELHTVRIVAQHVGEGDDLQPDDNEMEVIMTTASIRIPSIELTNQSTATMAGGTVFAEANLMNTGNAVENRLSIHASISSSPPVPGLIAFFTVDGGDRAVAQDVPVIVPAGGELRLRMDVLIPDDAPLNTRFVVQFEVLGAVDENGLPMPMSVQALVMLNQQRQLTTDVGLEQVGSVPSGTSALVLVNLTSTSSMNEDVTVAFSEIEGWQISCDKRLVNASGVMVSFASGHMTPQTNQLRCEVLRLSGALEGTVVVSTRTTDGYLQSEATVELMFDAPPVAEGLSSTVIAAGGFGGIAFIAALVFLMRSRANDEDEFEELALQQSGPPASAHHATENTASSESNPPELAGPPSSNLQSERRGPPLPEGGLPAGWTEEQWEYYGQQYLDGTL